MKAKSPVIKVVFLSLLLFGIISVISLLTTQKLYPQPPKREMRAVWISTAMNLDWPTSSKISTEKQKQELIEQLDLHQKNGINTIIFQVRPCADAFYQSSYEPWSMWLAGEQGKAPAPFFDPLEFAVSECHKRHMEIHAWFNPFRAVTDTGKMYRISPDHIINRMPHWFAAYGKTLYFNPGIHSARTWIVKVIADVVSRYDIDGVHFDDYFYPYKIKDLDFPDSATFAEYSRGFAPDRLEDWRRDNINLFIENVSDTIKQLKPWVKFGVAPFGVWRNKSKDPDGSDTRAGAPSYDVLYADVLKWLREGWIDYITPQVYWEIGNKFADYETIIKWWSTHHYDRHVYIGHSAYKVDPGSEIEAWRTNEQLFKQIVLTRQTPNIVGSMHFRSRTFIKNNSLSDELRTKMYPTVALIPTMPWLDNKPPLRPQKLKAKKAASGTWLLWESLISEKELEKPVYYVVYRFQGDSVGSIEDARNIYAITDKPRLQLPERKAFFLFFRRKYTFQVTAVDRLHNESLPSEPIVLKTRS